MIVEVVALPDKGKTFLSMLLEKELTRVGLSVKRLENRNKIAEKMRVALQQGEALIRSGRSDDQEKVRRRFRSLMFRAIAILLYADAQDAREDIVLFEHGLYFTLAVEANGPAGVPIEALMSDLEVMREPDLVIYLPATTDELRQRGSSSFPKHLQHICEGMEFMSREKGWLRVETQGKRTENIVRACFEKILAIYESQKLRVERAV